MAPSATKRRGKMTAFEKLKEEVEAAAVEARKFYEKGNKSAGVRLRAHMQEVKTLAQAVRLEVSEAKGE